MYKVWKVGIIVLNDGSAAPFQGDLEFGNTTDMFFFPPIIYSLLKENLII